MKIRILQDTVADQKLVKAGDIVDVSDKNARLLVGMKKAEKVEVVANEEAQAVVDSPDEAAIEPQPEQEAEKVEAPKKKGKKQ